MLSTAGTSAKSGVYPLIAGDVTAAKLVPFSAVQSPVVIFVTRSVVAVLVNFKLLVWSGAAGAPPSYVRMYNG